MPFINPKDYCPRYIMPTGNVEPIMIWGEVSALLHAPFQMIPQFREPKPKHTAQDIGKPVARTKLKHLPPVAFEYWAALKLAKGEVVPGPILPITAATIQNDDEVERFWVDTDGNITVTHKQVDGAAQHHLHSLPLPGNKDKVVFPPTSAGYVFMALGRQKFLELKSDLGCTDSMTNNGWLVPRERNAAGMSVLGDIYQVMEPAQNESYPLLDGSNMVLTVLDLRPYNPLAMQDIERAQVQAQAPQPTILTFPVLDSVRVKQLLRLCNFR